MITSLQPHDFDEIKEAPKNVVDRGLGIDEADLGFIDDRAQQRSQPRL